MSSLRTSGGQPESDVSASGGLVLKSPCIEGELRREIHVLREDLRKAVEQRERVLLEAAASRIEQLEEIKVSVKW